MQIREYLYRNYLRTGPLWGPEESGKYFRSLVKFRLKEQQQTLQQTKHFFVSSRKKNNDFTQILDMQYIIGATLHPRPSP